MIDQFIVDNFSVENSGQSLLRSISFSLQRGSWLSIVGPNGAGKSTLLKSLAGIIKTSSGESWLGDVHLNALTLRERACYLSYVPQQFEPLMPFTVDQFLALALYAECSEFGEDKIRAAYQLFRLDGLKKRSIQKLSVGEMQRVLLAAAFVQGGEVLLLDEPSSALDPFEENEMLKILQQLKRDARRTIVFVTHHLSSALSLADRLLVLKGGENYFFGTAEAVIEEKVLDRAFGHPFRIMSEGKDHIVMQSFSAPVTGGSGEV